MEHKNAVLEDKELQEALKGINPKVGDFVTRVAGEAWGLPLIDQKTKALITIAVDVVNQDHIGSGNPFAAHVNMALKQGATRAEVEELLLFMCVYAGFNKAAGCFGTLNEIFDQTDAGKMISVKSQADYAWRDQQGKVVFYVLLWKRKGITLELLDDYWRNVHGPVCARLPGQHQYWQFHLSDARGDLWPTLDSISNAEPEAQFNGIAELTFATEEDRQTWFKAAAILIDDEHNIFSKAIGYTTHPGNSQTYIDRIPTGDPNGALGILKFHVMVKKSDGVSVEEFREYLTNSFAAAIVKSDLVLKFRLHLFEEVDNSRPDAAGVSHHELPEKQYQAAFEIAFSNPLEMEKFFTSQEYATAVKEQAKYVKQINPFPERAAYTFVYDGQMTLAGQRSSTVAELIAQVGANNQLKSDIHSLMNGKVSHMPDKQNTKLPTLNSQQEGARPQRVHATFSSPVDASLSTVWNVMLDKVENPGRYNPEAQDYKILERYSNGVLRQMKVLDMTVKEIINWDEKTREIRHTLVDNPLFIGQAVNAVIQPAAKNPDAPLIIAYTLDWEPYNQEARKVAQEIQEKIAQAVQQAVLSSTTVAEQQDAQKESQGREIMSEQSLSEQLEAAVQLSEFVISENWEEVKPFLTEDIFYKVGSSEPVYGKQAVVEFLSSLFQTTAKFTGHNVRKSWNEPGIIVVEMDAKYTTVKDNRHLSIACCDIYRMRGNQVSEWRVYADLLPFYQTDPEEQQPQENADEINSSPVLA